MSVEYPADHRRYEAPGQVLAASSYGFGVSHPTTVPMATDEVIDDGPNSGIAVASMIVLSALFWIALGVWLLR